MPQEESAGDVWEDLARKYGKPGEPDYHNNLGNSYRGRGQLDAAIAEYREAIRLKPSDEVFHCNLTIAFVEKGEHGEALREYEEALRLNPRDYHSHYSLGNLLSKLGRVDEAIAEYERAIAAEPERPEAHFNLAARGKALVFAQKALELDPKDEGAKQVAVVALAAYEKAKPPEKAAPEQLGAGQRLWWQFWKK